MFYVVLMKLGWRRSGNIPQTQVRCSVPPERRRAGGPGSRASAANFQSSCVLLTVGPDYKRRTKLPGTYKADELGAWKEGRPLDNVPKADGGIFGDAALNTSSRKP